MSKINQVTLLERYQRLTEISRDLASTLDLTTLLDHIGHAAADLSNAEAASILLYDENKQQLHFVSATNLDEPLMRGLVVPVDSSIAGWIVLNRQPIIISDAQKDPRHFGNVGKATNVTTNSLLGVPLIAKNKVIGALEAINKRSGAFNEEDQDVLMALGAQAAVAIQNTRLFQQSDLISEMVHELRTPLASLNTAAHLLTREDLPEKQRHRVVQMIHSETMRLSDLATAFLDLARLESGRVQFLAEVFDPRVLLEECASVVRGKASENALTLNLSIPDQLAPLRADRDKIKQVILNLLSNAIKYNRPDGSITVGAHVNGDNLIISISDTGPGIGPEDQKHLFEKFYRVRSSEDLAPGSGLGLAISQRIVEAHGGDINLESEVGVGSTFNILLPLKTGIGG
ncbi:MAG: GAF domain-containing sensor histidine kinase [Anaerolineales bacterium]|jgi:signal transduction histidine kinase